MLRMLIMVQLDQTMDTRSKFGKSENKSTAYFNNVIIFSLYLSQNYENKRKIASRLALGY